MPEVTLWGLEESVYTRIVRLALEEKRVGYILMKMDVFAEDGPSPSHLVQHPFARIPSLVHGYFGLYETAAMTRYVDGTFLGPSLQPGDVVARARMNQIINVLDAYGYRPMVWDVYVQRLVIPTEGGRADEQVITNALPAIQTVLDQLNRWLGGNEFLAGDSLTLADLYGLPMLRYFDETPEGSKMLSSYRCLQEWLLRMATRQSAQTVMPC